MDRWWSQLYCARVAYSFNLMPWRYKALDFSEILFPLSVTWYAHVCGTFAVHAGYARGAWIYEAATFFIWCWYTALLLLLVRGQQALRKGIRPTSDVKLQNPKKERYDLIAAAILVGFFLLPLLLLNVSLPPLKRSASDWALPCVFFALFWQQVVRYFRSRFLAASVNCAT